MAYVSPYDIGTKLINLVSTLVGAKLSTVPAATGTKPAVIRSGGYDTDTQAPVNEPQWPYIAVDYVGQRRWGDADVKNVYFDETNKEVTETDIILYYDIKCYGLVKNDTGKIMDELSRKLESSSVREFIRTNFECNLFRTDDVRPFKIKRSTNFVEVNRLQIQLIQTSSHTDPISLIGTIDSEGELLQSPEDTTPLIVTIEAP